MANSSNCAAGSPTVSERRKAGRPPKLSPEQALELQALAREQPTLSLDDLTRLFVERAGVRVSPATVKVYLAKAGFVRVRRRRRAPSMDNDSRQTQWPGADGASAAAPGPAPARYGYTAAHRDEGDADRYPAGLTDAEWELVADLFEHEGPGKPPRYPRRQIMDACCYVVRSGCPWRLLPRDLPPWQNVYAHFRRWTADGMFERMHDRLRAMWRQREHRAPEPTAAVIDAQSVKTSDQGGPKGYDAGKKIKGRKRHLVTDTLGLLLAVLVHPADIQDRDGAPGLVQIAVTKYPSIQKLFADGGYAGHCAKDLRERYGLDVEVIRRPTGRWHDGQLPLFDEPTGFVVLPKRWVVERTNAWNSRPRRMAKDQDRRLDVAAAWIRLVEARILLRRFAQPQQPAAAAART